MNSQLARFTADHHAVVSAASAAAGFTDPVAFDADDYAVTLLKNARGGRS